MIRPRALVAGAVLAVAGVVAPGAPALAAAPGGVVEGHDVSYPQCGAPLPPRGDIAVVGVNAGIGTTSNPCLADQLAWGDTVAGDGTALLADVYVNTANPGHLGGWWPSANRTRTGAAVHNPNGTCVGAENAACAYVYGYSVAADDLLTRGVPDPVARTWWLDVETMNSWSWDRTANRAVIEGMTVYLQGAGARVGLYSTDRQWSLIAGGTPASSPLAGLPSWKAGAVTRDGALAGCRSAPLTPGGRVVMAQWVVDAQDHDRSCLPGSTGTARPDAGTATTPPPTAATAAPTAAPPSSPTDAPTAVPTPPPAAPGRVLLAV